MEVICLEDAAFYELIETVFERLKDKSTTQPPKWVSGEEAMRILSIKSKTTLQQLRDEGKVRFSQPMQRVILYDRDSLEAYIEHNAKETF